MKLKQGVSRGLLSDPYLHVSFANNAEGLVDFVEIDLLGSDVGVLQSLGDRKWRSSSEVLRGLNDMHT